MFFFRPMTTLRVKNEVDPARFIGKTFTRRQAFSHSPDDFSIIIDGLTAGRIMKKNLAFQEVAWFWTLTAPHYPLGQIHSGEEETFEAARDAFKKLFWEWHAWALKQPGKVTWYGADE